MTMSLETEICHTVIMEMNRGGTVACICQLLIARDFSVEI